MEQETTMVNIKSTINAPIAKVWELWNDPRHVTQWNSAHPDWHSPSAANDLRVGGTFSYRMEAKDGSFGFDFGGVYDDVQEHRHISYTMSDGRRVSVNFESEGDNTRIDETFEAETQNPVDMQRSGWQAILDNFKKYVEEKSE